MQNYVGVLFIVLMERKIQRKFQRGSSLATSMKQCTYVLNNRKIDKTFFIAFDRMETILGTMLIFNFYWLKWEQIFHQCMLNIPLF